MHVVFLPHMTTEVSGFGRTLGCAEQFWTSSRLMHAVFTRAFTELERQKKDHPKTGFRSPVANAQMRELNERGRQT